VDFQEEEAQLEAAARPAGVFAGSEGKDFRVLAAGTAQNIVGLGVFVVGSFAANVLIARSFGGGQTGAIALAIVTVGTQFAFILAAGSRFGMDMAAVRYVAIPFVALTYVWVAGSRGLKVMRHTLYVQWIAQPLLWIVLMLAFWQVDKSEAATVWAYAASWCLAALAGRFFWRSISDGHEREDLEPGTAGALVRYGAPRAPAALLSQGLFWIDYFVASHFVAAGYVTAAEVGVYSACVRVALAMVLFLTAVSYVFSPFVADLHARGERDRLDALFKAITRWTVAGTIPVLLLMLIVPSAILRVFGGAEFASGSDALRILVIGQAINVSVGAAGFVLIMAGRTGWDLVVYAVSAALDLTLAWILVPRFGIEGAAAAQAITIALSNWLRLALVRRFVHIFPWDLMYLRLVIPTLACATAMLVAHEVTLDTRWFVQLVVVAILGTIAYVPALLVFGLTTKERIALRNGIAKLRAR
jgi:O-antigen/teichoic acid export membrane protein